LLENLALSAGRKTSAAGPLLGRVLEKWTSFPSTEGCCSRTPG